MISWIYIFFAIIGIIIIHYAWRYAIFSARRRKRRGWNKDRFTRILESNSIPLKVANIVYDVIQEQVPVRDFPIKPDDNLLEVYGIGGPFTAEMDEIIEDIYFRMKRPEPTEKEIAIAITKVGKFVTVQDLAHIVTMSANSSCE